MARPREGNYNQIPLNLDRNEVDLFNKNFGKGRLSEIVREYIHDENVRIEKEKKVNARTKSAINNFECQANKYYLTNDKNQVTLDLYKMDKRDLNKELDGITEAKDLIGIRDRAKMVHAIAQTRLKKL